MLKIRVSDVFKSTGQPNVTYVQRENGKYEKLLRSGLEANGRACIVTGPSKTGKTTLYRHVLDEMIREPIIIRCNRQLSADEFWKYALESINFDRISEKSKQSGMEFSGSGKIGATFGWKWLASLIGEASLGVKKEMSESDVREIVLAKPSPSHLIPALRSTPAVLVIEDFHYLSEITKETISQQWKEFCDQEVSIIIVSTTHHANHLANSNNELSGRISMIQVNGWEIEDLKSIALKGFEKMEIDFPIYLASKIAKESVGLPIITQDCCRQLFIDKDLIFAPEKGIEFTDNDIWCALNNIAVINYANLEHTYQLFEAGPRKRARKYETYELLLAAFALDPITFELKKHEIGERFDKLNLDKKKRPPQASINATLNAIKAFQERHNINLMEWDNISQKIFIVEPTFLFFIRWRNVRNESSDKRNLLFELLKSSLLITPFSFRP